MVWRKRGKGLRLKCYMLALSAIFGHAGFQELLLGNSWALVGHFHHELHHRYFECNYGSVDFPLDVWFFFAGHI